MKDGVRVHSPLNCIVQSVLDQPSIWFGRDRTWCGGQSAVNLAVKSEQIRKPACGTLPRQADSRGCDAVYISVKDVEVDRDFFGERHSSPMHVHRGKSGGLYLQGSRSAAPGTRSS